MARRPPARERGDTSLDGGVEEARDAVVEGFEVGE